MRQNIQQLLESEGFRERLLVFVRDSIVDLTNRTVGELVSLEQAHILVDKVDWTATQVAPLIQQRRALQGLLLREIKAQNTPLRSIMTAATDEKVRTMLGEPLDVPRDAVRQFLEQAAIKELFITIVHDSILAFYKQINPLAGAFGVFGLEDQIKSFVGLFIGGVLDSAASFITASENRVKFAGSLVALYDVVKHEKPAPYLDMFTEQNYDRFDAFGASLHNDDVFRREVLAMAHKVLGEFYDGLKDRRLKEFLAVEAALWAADTAPIVVDLVLPHLRQDRWVGFLAEEVARLPVN